MHDNDEEGVPEEEKEEGGRGEEAKNRRQRMRMKRIVVVFLSCPLVKKHADLLGSFLY